MWQSINIPGTPLETEAKTGAPTRQGGISDRQQILILSHFVIPAHGDVRDEVAALIGYLD